jgi:HSP20 family molecular chaperone IbpA
MWAEACQLLDEAERLHRQFFRLGAATSGARIAWEPPVDVYEDEDEVTIVVALPGTAPERVEVLHDPRGLVIRAERRLPIAGHGCAIRRLEIPHGYFERRIALPPGRLGPPHREWVNGCLVLVLRKLN